MKILGVLGAIVILAGQVSAQSPMWPLATHQDTPTWEQVQEGRASEYDYPGWTVNEHTEIRPEDIDELKTESDLRLALKRIIATLIAQDREIERLRREVASKAVITLLTPTDKPGYYTDGCNTYWMIADGIWASTSINCTHLIPRD